MPVRGDVFAPAPIEQAPTNRGRPMGDVAQVLVQLASSQPGTVRDLAQRGQVGYGVARYTASRLVERGLLEPLDESRPMVLATPGHGVAPSRAKSGAHLQQLPRSFWEEL